MEALKSWEDKMGEIIIKVPEDIKEVIELNLSYTEIFNKLGIKKEEEKIIEKFFATKFPQKKKNKTWKETKDEFYEELAKSID